ncbi:hypothetical protein Holit_03295 [Hollandina sp. SP2]
MKRVSFSPRFVNETRDDLIPGKIHTIRQNYSFWKKFEGRDVELFKWEEKPYRSNQQVICVKRLVSVQKVRHAGQGNFFTENERYIPMGQLVVNDGFRDEDEFIGWFVSYSEGEMGILHFTEWSY